MNILEKLKGPSLDAAFMALAEREKDSSIGYLQLKDILAYKSFIPESAYLEVENLLKDCIAEIKSDLKSQLESYIKNERAKGNVIFWLDYIPFNKTHTKEEIENFLIELNILEKRLEIFCPRHSGIIYCGFELHKKFIVTRAIKSQRI